MSLLTYLISVSLHKCAGRSCSRFIDISILENLDGFLLENSPPKKNRNKMTIELNFKKVHAELKNVIFL